MWDERYSVDGFVYGTEPNTFLRDHAHRLPAGRAMCLADGEGRNAVFMALQGWDTHSVDLAASGVDKSRRLAAEHGVTVNAQVGDLGSYDLGEAQWDTIVSIFAHMPPAIRTGLHRRVVRALKPGGVLLLEAYTPDQIGRGTGGPPVAEMTMTLAGLREELAGLHFEHAWEGVRDVVEGVGHTGDGAVVQVIARKPS